MATKRIEPPRRIYQIKVTLRGARPPIWRRLLVSSNITLARLHDVLQEAMGWTDSHLHEFRIGEQRFGVPDPDDVFLGGPRTRSEKTARLDSVLSGIGSKAIYAYDFGDDWEHDIVVEKVLPPEPGVAYPQCTGGKRHGPPEDCGGVFGCYNLLETLRDPDHEDHEQMVEWIGGEFDPEAFSVDEVNERFAPFQSRRN